MLKGFLLAAALCGLGESHVPNRAHVNTPHFSVEAPDAYSAGVLAKEAERVYAEWYRMFRGGVVREWPTPVIVIATIGPQVDADDENGYAKPISPYHCWIDLKSRGIVHATETLGHEIAHVLVGREMGGDLGKCWFAEGMATYFEAVDLGKIGRLENKVNLVYLGIFFERKGVPYAESWKGFYGQGYSVCRYIAETYGVDRIFPFYRVGLEQGWEVACISILGVTLDTLDQEWEASLGAPWSPYPK